MEHEKVERISELTKISRERPLTEQEAAERAALRKQYLDGFRENMKNLLDSVVVERPDGSRESLHQKS